ncbi:MAG: hypothetical protein UT50_C0015G0014 [Candidatus Moranbacteria bacterium GW2011_GWA2_39_41]|nr:MAG: hypothetical protein UT50_C0015G0014 [Candidatus Moranbacteria bacterium GW2011_GWA2_39_41]
MFKVKYKKLKINRGFSLMESMLSVFVLLIGIVGVISLMVSSTKHSMDSRDTIIATELAQEGLELVRNVRDNNVAGGKDSFVDFPVSESHNCRVSYNSSGSIPCDSSYVLNYVDNFYTHSGSGATKFQRKIEFDYDQSASAASTKVTVTSTVVWGGSFPTSCTVADKCTSVQSILVAR